MDNFESFINQSVVDTATSPPNTDFNNLTDADVAFFQYLLENPNTVDPSSLNTNATTTSENTEAISDEYLSAFLSSVSGDNTVQPAAMQVDSSQAQAQTQAPPEAPPSMPANPVDIVATTNSASTTTTAPVKTKPKPKKTASPSPSPSTTVKDEEGVDMKSLSSKERRQIRNKISARNFRVRRKEYISNLEAEVRLHKEESECLRTELAQAKRDNTMMREELQRLRQKISTMSVSQQPSPAPSKPKVVVRFNPNKDVSQTNPKKKGNWAAKSESSGFIAVNTCMTGSAVVTRQQRQVIEEAQRKQAVNELLSISPEIVAPPELIPMFLEFSNIMAEFLISQLALESSLALTCIKVSC